MATTLKKAAVPVADDVAGRDHAIDLAAEFIRLWEDLRLKAYQCSAGKWTIGYGSTEGVKPGDTITEAEAEERLRRDMAWAVEAVDLGLQGIAAAPEERAALISLCFNIGAPAFRGSTAVKRLLAGDRAGAAEAITWWNKITDPKTGRKRVERGLVRRRAEERDLFLSAKEAAHVDRREPAEAEAQGAAVPAGAGAAEPDLKEALGDWLAGVLRLLRAALLGPRS